MVFNISAEKAYKTPLSGIALLPMLLLSLTRQRHSPRTAKSIKTEYDYIIVGAGSAGSVVASRLSEIPCVSVLLLEAGKPPPLLTEIPAITRTFWLSDINWGYLSTPQKYSARLLNNRQMNLPLGKTIGGSSVLQDMIYIRGNMKNYDNWAAEGATGWSYKDVLPYFLKLEDNRDPEFVINGFHNVGGPQTAMRPRYKGEMEDPIYQAAQRMGYKVVDSNAARQTGFSVLQATLRDGQTCSTAKAYLVPADNRTNLDILPNAMVRKVLIKKRRAVGVQFDFQGQTYEVKAKREVIVSAGALNTPKLLMLSGIGPKKELERFKIPVVADLPVGKNLQDHCASMANFLFDKRIPSILLKMVNPRSIAQYLKNRSGPLASAGFANAIAFLKGSSLDPKKDDPNFQLVFVEALADVLPFLNLSLEAFLKVFFPYEGRSLYTCAAYLLQPRSRGTVTLQSTDPYDPPLIDPNFLEDPKDMQDIVDGLKACNRIGNSPEMRQQVGSTPFQTLIPGCEKFAANEDRYLWCQVRAISFSVGHPVGTARMGRPADPRTVVDPQLRVKNIKGLRVVDASVMPIIPSGNTNAPTIMVGEKASDIIKATIKCHRDTQSGHWGETDDFTHNIKCHKGAQKEDFVETENSNHNPKCQHGEQKDWVKPDDFNWSDLKGFPSLHDSKSFKDFLNKSEKESWDYDLP